MPKYTPDQIRDIGDKTIPAVADSYETLKTKVNDAKSAVDSTFGDSSLIPHKAAGHFMMLWERYVTVAETTPETLNDMGRTFVEIADEYERNEGEAKGELDELLAGLEDTYVENSKEDE